MLFHMMGTDGETETAIRIKLWPIISLLVAGMVGLGAYTSNHESRLCVTEKAVETAAAAVVKSDTKIHEVDQKLDKMYRDQDLFFSLREPRWKEWKDWNEKKRKKGDEQ